MKFIQEHITDLTSNQWYIYVLILAVSFIVYLITRYVVLKSISLFFKKTSTDLDDILVERGLLNRLSYLPPLIIIYNLNELIPEFEFIYRILLGIIALVVMTSINAFISASSEIYSRSRYAGRLNMKSYLQVLKLIVNLFGIIVIIAVLSGKSPFYLLSGIGALTAVLMLIFKDTILSLVSSIQISSNDLFKVGDWVEAPHFGADGDVIDIGLHTIKIQNWDKTISIIPTHKLVDSSFKNWRGMSDSGGRRIKRSINIDMNSIKFCSDLMIDKYKKFNILEEYFDSKLLEIDKDNSDNNVSDDTLINGRSLTNIGTFRAYIEAYLRNNAHIHTEMTFLVRQLSPGSNGIPIEIYVFSNDTNWVSYEAIQSDIFDHLLAIIPEFGLRVFQNPTGNDFSKISNK
jgi:miniconductance mechanosensitive channel